MRPRGRLALRNPDAAAKNLLSETTEIFAAREVPSPIIRSKLIYRRGAAAGKQTLSQGHHCYDISVAVQFYLWKWAYHLPAYDEAFPKSELRGAMNYARNNWDELLTYVSDGRVPLDNNVVEQLMKQVAARRKNWLFAGSLASGQRAARLLSVVTCAWRNELDLERYLTDLLTQLLHGCRDDESLLPHVWLTALALTLLDVPPLIRSDPSAVKSALMGGPSSRLSRRPSASSLRSP